MRLVGTYHGQRMCVLGLVRSGQRDKSKGNMESVACPAGRIDNGGRVVTSLWFLIGAIKKDQVMYERKFANLNRKLSIQKEKALKPIKKAQMEFYVELTKELHKSNKLDCGRESDKRRRKRVSYMANKLRQ